MEKDNYGGFWRRLIAFLIDLCIISIFTCLITYAGTKVLEAFVNEDALKNSVLASSLLFYTLFIFYFIYFHGTLGQTPGKIALRLKVLQESGDPVSLGTAFLRLVGYIVSASVLCVGFLWIVFDGKKQGWHDKIARTKVMKVEKPGERPPEDDSEIISTPE